MCSKCNEMILQLQPRDLHATGSSGRALSTERLTCWQAHSRRQPPEEGVSVVGGTEKIHEWGGFDVTGT